MHSIFFELTAVFILAGGIAFIASLFKQPSIIAYLITGLIVGPLGYYRLSQGDLFQGLGEVGITLLLFMIGLDLDITQLKRIGRTAFMVGTGQVIITTLLGFAICKLLGMTSLASLYVGIALTFSSTIIVVKLLTEKKDLNSLYGKLAIGIFLVQDFAAITILILLSSTKALGSEIINFSNPEIWTTLTLTLIKGGAIAAIVYWHSKYLFPKILRYVGKSEEMLLIFSLAWALGFAALVSLPVIGFNLEIGGFVAGLALANSAAHYQIAARIKSLRDFFIILFFIFLGSQITLSGGANLIPKALILSLFVLVGNGLIVMILLGLVGYKPRTSFMTGVTVTQVSEFSLILMALGLELGHITNTEISLVTMISLITIAVSAYLILYSEQIYTFLKKPLQILNFAKGHAESGITASTLKNHIILIGAHRLGHQIIHALEKQNDEFLIIDFNPDIVAYYAEKKIPIMYGDISDPDIQDTARIHHAKLVIATLPSIADNAQLIELLKKHNHKVKVIVTAHDEAEALYLYEKGADYVIVPHIIGGLHVAKFFDKSNGLKDLATLKKHHLKMLTSHHII